jgi:pyridinium-3,5-bisthiocarboxylic acid mononucleotide nickel chelatase
LHLHLKFFGGFTGDTFIAAVLDAFPRFEPRVIASIDALDAPYPVICSLIAQADAQMSGHRFEIEPFIKYLGHIPVAFSREPARWDSVRERLNSAEIDEGIRTHATKIFELMVRAEAAAHDIAPGKVVFEAGAWKSMAQVVGAATLIEALVPAQWSVSGSAPSGLSRIAAAIVDYLWPPSMRGRPLPSARSLVATGSGFGLLSAQNVRARLLCFEEGETTSLELDALSSRRVAGRPDLRTRQ